LHSLFLCAIAGGAGLVPGGTGLDPPTVCWVLQPRWCWSCSWWCWTYSRWLPWPVKLAFVSSREEQEW
jgi:hypothetical protein